MKEDICQGVQVTFNITSLDLKGKDALSDGLEHLALSACEDRGNETSGLGSKLMGGERTRQNLSMNVKTTQLGKSRMHLLH